MLSVLKKFICNRVGHSTVILEVHEHKDLIRCSRCDKIHKTFYRGNEGR